MLAIGVEGHNMPGTLRQGEVDAGLQGRALTPVDQVGRHAGTTGQGLVACIVR